MLNILKNNEPIGNWVSIPALINNTICRGDNAMTDATLPNQIKKCQVKGCTRSYYAKGYCEKHRKQILKCGHVRSRTMFDPNTFVIEGTICRIGIFNRKCKQIAEAIVDAEDYSLVKKFKWSLNTSKYGVYVVTGAGKNRIRLHSLVMGIFDSQMIDHEDHNTMDNRKTNLRECSRGQNRQNSKISLINNSGVKNAFWDKKHKKWKVSITANKKRHYIGRFANLSDAKQAAIEARNKHHGNFANHG